MKRDRTAGPGRTPAHAARTPKHAVRTVEHAARTESAGMRTRAWDMDKTKDRSCGSLDLPHDPCAVRAEGGIHLTSECRDRSTTRRRRFAPSRDQI